MAFNFENLVKNIFDSASQGVSTAVEAIKDPEKAAEQRRERERTAVPEITSYYMNADQEPIGIPNKKAKADLGSVSSDVVTEEDQNNEDDSEDEHAGGSARIQRAGSNLEPSFITSNGGYIYDENNRNDLHNIEREFSEWKQDNDFSGFKGDMRRRFFDSEGNLVNPLTWQKGFSSQVVTPDVPKRLYEAHFKEEDDSGYENKDRVSNRLQNGIVTASDIDDGNPEGRSALYMDGPTYRKYVEWGIPGRPLEEISDDPNKFYSKQDEMEQYGFIPYLPDEESIWGTVTDDIQPWDYLTGQVLPKMLSSNWTTGFHNRASAQTINNAFNDLADLRRNITDFTVTDGNGKYSGKTFLDSFSKASDRMNDQGNDLSLEVTDPSLANEYSIPYKLVNLKTNQVAPSSNYYVVEEDNGGYTVVFDDGEEWIFNNKEDLETNTPYQRTDGDDAVKWKNVDPLVLPDGSIIRADKAWDIYDQINGNKSESGENLVDYGPSRMGKPVTDFPNPLEGLPNPFNKNITSEEFADTVAKNNAAPEDFVDKAADFVLSGEINPWMLDTLLGSFPYFWLAPGMTKGMSRVASEQTGFEPGRNDSGIYRMLSDDPSEDEANWRSLGSAILPLTEHLWGPIGHNTAGKAGQWFLKNVFKRELAQPGFVPWLIKGALGEGAEEIPGNLTEELERSGLNDYYKDYETTAWDTQGHPMRINNSLEEKLWNFAQDIPEAVTGGFLLGLPMGVLNKDKYNEERLKYEQNKEKKLNEDLDGIKVDSASVSAPEEQKDYYNMYGNMRPRTEADNYIDALLDEEVSDQDEYDKLVDGFYDLIEKLSNGQ